ESKLKKLKIRARRNGAHNIETRVIDSTKVIKKLHNSADRLLLDVPCSGLGVLKRNPDSKWKLDQDFIDRIMVVQQDILTNYSKMVKKGGQMVYATCSVLPQENTLEVKKFRESGNGRECEWGREHHVHCSESGYASLCMALVQRKRASSP